MAETTVQKPVLNEEIALTAKAAAQVARIREENNIPASHALRIGVKGGRLLRPLVCARVR